MSVTNKTFIVKSIKTFFFRKYINPVLKKEKKGLPT